MVLCKTRALLNTLAMPMYTQDTSASTMKHPKMSSESTNSRTSLFPDCKFWRKLSFCTLPTKKTIMTSWRQKLINIQDNTNSTSRVSSIQIKRYLVESEWKNWTMPPKMTTLVILSVDLRIAEMMISEDGLQLKRRDSSTIDLLHLSQSMYSKYWERNVTWIMNNLVNRTMSGESLLSKSPSDLIDSKGRDLLRRNILRFHLRMLFPLFRIDRFSFIEVLHLFTLMIWIVLLELSLELNWWVSSLRLISFCQPFSLMIDSDNFCWTFQTITPLISTFKKWLHQKTPIKLDYPILIIIQDRVSHLAWKFYTQL